MLRDYNLSKLLFLLGILSAVFLSCRSKPEIVETTVKAKLKDNNNGSLYIDKIDPLYRVGDVVGYSFTSRTATVIEIEERPFVHIVYPEEIREVSHDANNPDVLEAYQHDDTLELRFKH